MLQSDLAVDRYRRSIGRLAAQPWLCAADPGRDFVRSRKLPLPTMLHLLVVRDCRSVGTELLDNLGWTADAPSVSAYCRARRKLNDLAMPLLNSTFLREWDVVPYLGEFRLMIADGTGIPIPASGDADTMIRNGRGGLWHNECHPTLAYDPLRDTFEDVAMQGAKKSNEPAALCAIVDRFWPGRAPDGTALRALWLGDRNYCTLNVFCHMVEAGASFCIRANDRRAEDLLVGDVPEGEFEETVELILTRTRGKARRSRPDEPERYRCVRSAPLDVVRDGSSDEYPIELRVVRVALPADDGDPDGDGDEWLNLVTDLPAERFAPGDLADLYGMRWDLELGIRDLKHVVGMKDPRTRDPRLAAQEFWGSVVCYNVCSMGSKGIPEPGPGPKRDRATDKAVAFRGMRRKMLGCTVDLEAVCERFSHSVRPGRKAPMRKRPQRPPGFAYRG